MERDAEEISEVIAQVEAPAAGTNRNVQHQRRGKPLGTRIEDFRNEEVSRDASGPLREPNATLTFVPTFPAHVRTTSQPSTRSPTTSTTDPGCPPPLDKVNSYMSSESAFPLDRSTNGVYVPILRRLRGGSA